MLSTKPFFILKLWEVNFSMYEHSSWYVLTTILTDLLRGKGTPLPKKINRELNNVELAETTKNWVIGPRSPEWEYTCKAKQLGVQPACRAQISKIQLWFNSYIYSINYYGLSYIKTGQKKSGPKISGKWPARIKQVKMRAEDLPLAGLVTNCQNIWLVE